MPIPIKFFSCYTPAVTELNSPPTAETKSIITNRTIAEVQAAFRNTACIAKSQSEQNIAQMLKISIALKRPIRRLRPV